ncbi:alpha/beta hydrolase [Bacillus arachidis]|uniref:Alpha/beta hydrolase family protein n=1 Tax=Bacillus arachidis TaxID=2819290 RepID=A0ABS3NXB3_9BACI|nr:alpha/beta hydrolase family protein [Bacillus arachidis]MBO1625589.1 alpha/beta hydrolase family protein [Bacillus arachidis]
MIIWKMIEQFALYDLHKKKSKDLQFNRNFPKLEGEKRIEEFYKLYPAAIAFNLHELQEGRYEIGEFKYESAIQSDHLNNDIVKGEAYLNTNKEVPNVIFVHGWRMESNDRVKNIFHKRIMDLGWNMYYFTLPYHFERKPEESLYSGEYMISANIQRTIQSVQQAVVDLRALIDWIKRNKKGQIVLIGISLGGFITNLTALVESNIDVLASILYANQLSYSIWNTSPGKFIKADLQHHGVTYEQLIQYWKVTEPSQALPKVNKENILLLSAKYDQYVHFQDTEYLWTSWDKPTRYIYNSGHAGIVLKRNKIATDTLGFICSRIMRK